MDNWKKFFLFGLGLLLIIVQSLFLTLTLTIVWALVVSWITDEPWWLLFLIGFVTDVFYLTPLGRTSLILLVIGLVTKHVKNILGFRESYKMKISRF